MDFKASRVLGVLPLLLSLALGAFAALPQIRAHSVLLDTFLITAGLLATWSLALTVWMKQQQREPEFAIALLKQHYIQACAHTSILVYWGWYYRHVYDEAYLILAQLVFAYAFDMLLQLSRRGRYSLGFGPFPVILSTNLFLWFKNDWFYFQFALIAVGFAAKELIHWTRNGKSVHIFNPSSFPLAVASWLLLFAHRFDLTWGEQIAGSQYRPPHIFLFMFLVALPGQFFFGVATMTLAAVVTMYAWGAAYFALTGTPFFYQGYIPIAVFLAMLLLFTDPSTSPRSELARILYGILYAATVILLEGAIRPPFPAKLLLVPLLNLGVPLFERVKESRVLRYLDPARVAPEVMGRRRNLGYMAIWASVFGVLLWLGGIGDDFPGQGIPLWRQACHDRGGRACERLSFVEDTACTQRSAWACNELGVTKHAQGNDSEAKKHFSKACRLQFDPGCQNERALAGNGAQLTRGPPRLSDYPVLMSEFKGIRRPKLNDMSRPELLAEACAHGWTEACADLNGTDRPGLSSL